MKICYISKSVIEIVSLLFKYYEYMVNDTLYFFVFMNNDLDYIETKNSETLSIVYNYCYFCYCPLALNDNMKLIFTFEHIK